MKLPTELRDLIRFHSQLLLTLIFSTMSFTSTGDFQGIYMGWRKGPQDSAVSFLPTIGIRVFTLLAFCMSDEVFMLA